ncbi:MAG: DUF167 family protein [Bdellovibrionota bacterium]|nr:DUF167 family protein [Bdellovibrionota bacterium]
MSYLAESNQGLVLKLYVQPGAKKTEVVGLVNDEIKIRLAAPPVDGKANKALLKFLKKSLKKYSYELIKGDLSRHKCILIHCEDPESAKKEINDFFTSFSS